MSKATLWKEALNWDLAYSFILVHYHHGRNMIIIHSRNMMIICGRNTMIIHYHHGSRQVGKILTPYILSHRKGRQKKRLQHLTCDLESSRSTPIVIAPSIRPQLLQQDYTSSRKTTPPLTRPDFPILHKQLHCV